MNLTPDDFDEANEIEHGLRGMALLCGATCATWAAFIALLIYGA